MAGRASSSAREYSRSPSRPPSPLLLHGIQLTSRHPSSAAWETERERGSRGGPVCLGVVGLGLLVHRVRRASHVLVLRLELSDTICAAPTTAPRRPNSTEKARYSGLRVENRCTKRLRSSASGRSRRHLHHAPNSRPISWMDAHPSSPTAYSSNARFQEIPTCSLRRGTPSPLASRMRTPFSSAAAGAACGRSLGRAPGRRTHGPWRRHHHREGRQEQARIRPLGHSPQSPARGTGTRRLPPRGGRRLLGQQPGADGLLAWQAPPAGVRAGQS